MNYKELNDNELIELSLEHNEEATSLLIDKYKNIIFTTLKDYKKRYNIIGIEVSDLYQEGLIGLFNAIETYDKNKDTLFYTYAVACIRSSIFSAIRKTFAEKNRILNNSYSLDFIYENKDENLYDFVKDEKLDPNNILLKKESEKDLLIKTKEGLSNSELTIFELKLKGLKNQDIADLLDKDKKHVENCLFRIARKLKDLIEK